jgi:transposase
MREGFDSLAAQARVGSFSGHVFCFRGRRGDLVKLLWWDGDGLCLYAKRLERGRFVWPRAEEGVVEPGDIADLGDRRGSSAGRVADLPGRPPSQPSHIVKRPVLTTSMQRTKMEHARYGKEPYSRIA